MILACDPGLSGAFAFMGALEIQIVDMPTHVNTVNKATRRQIDRAGIIDALAGFRAEGAARLVIEEVGGAPGQSASAAFNFGYGYGVVLAVAQVQGYEIERVAPAIWKRAMKAPADKRASRARATELMPAHAHLWKLAKHDGRAEAAMLGLYAERFLR